MEYNVFGIIVIVWWSTECIRYYCYYMYVQNVFLLLCIDGVQYARIYVVHGAVLSLCNCVTRNIILTPKRTEYQECNDRWTILVKIVHGAGSICIDYNI